MDALTQAMSEYARAIRGDWSDFDGRTMRSVIDSWVDEIRVPSDESLAYWRGRMNLCLTGGGHWCGPWKGHCSSGEEDWDCNCPCTEDD